MPPRILIGCAEIAKYTYNLTKGFRELGYEADSVVLRNGKNAFYREMEYTYDDLPFLEQTSFFAKSNGRVGIKTTKAFADFVKQYDIFIFMAGTSLFPRMVDLPILKSMGKTVIARQCGSEVRDTELAQIFWQAHGSEYPNYEQDRQTPPTDCATEYSIFQLDRYLPVFANKLHTTRMAEMYADSIISGPPSQTLGIRPYFQTGPIFDVRDFSFKVPRRQIPVIVHAPSSMRFKRSDIILDCLQQLRDEGVHFHLKVLRNMPHEVIRAELAEADMVIDQLSCGCGTLAYEGMASGCVVLGGHKDAASPLPRNRPVTHISVSTIKETVRQVIQDVPLRIRLAASAREYINEGYGSPASVAEYMLQSIERSRESDSDLYPVLFTANADAVAHEACPEYLREMTRKIFLKHGTHESTDVTRLVAADLVSPTDNEEVPRWDSGSLQKEGPWVLTGNKATYGRTV